MIKYSWSFEIWVLLDEITQLSKAVWNGLGGYKSDYTIWNPSLIIIFPRYLLDPYQRSERLHSHSRKILRPVNKSGRLIEHGYGHNRCLVDKDGNQLILMIIRVKTWSRSQNARPKVPQYGSVKPYLWQKWAKQPSF